MTTHRRIAWVESDYPYIKDKVEFLRDHGHDVTVYVTPAEFISSLDRPPVPDVTLLDIMLQHGSELNEVDTMAGHDTGLTLARLIHRRFPEMKVVGCSIRDPDETSNAGLVTWFNTHASGYWFKPTVRPNKMLLDRIERLFAPASLSQRAFIVHGHDEVSKLELKNYLQNTLHLPEPVILHEQPNQGKTIIEKFEHHAGQADIVFVLLTPDDPSTSGALMNSQLRRSRQNVIFELGFFCGKLGRDSGKIILLHKGDLDLPSDISGVIYINIDHGIQSAGEEIRRELR